MRREVIGDATLYLGGCHECGLSDQDIEDVWQSILEAIPEASEMEKRITFAKAILSARVAEL